MAGRGRFRVIRGGRPSDPLRFWPEARRKKPGWSRFLPLWSGAVGVGLLAGIGWAYLPGDGGSGPSARTLTVAAYAERLVHQGKLPASKRSFGFCHVGGGYNCVVDGDTLYLEGVKIRIADIDAPETHEPKCASEKELGDRATQRLNRLVNSGEVTLSTIARDKDRYGRKLRIVMVDGVSVGDTLVGEGLARWYEGGRRPWC
jgi:micrococcal nuclease